MKPVCHGIHARCVTRTVARLLFACPVLFSFPLLPSPIRISISLMEAKCRLAWMVPISPKVQHSKGLHAWRRRRRDSSVLPCAQRRGGLAHTLS